MVSLRCVDESNLEACSNLSCTPEQCQFTNSPVWSLLQTAYTPLGEHCKLYAIQDGGVVVGMVRLDFTLYDDCYMFTNLIIDQQYQRRHYATKAVKQALELFRGNRLHDVVKIHVAPENKNAVALDRKIGFVFCGKSKDDIFDVYDYKL